MSMVNAPGEGDNYNNADELTITDTSCADVTMVVGDNENQPKEELCIAVEHGSSCGIIAVSMNDAMALRDFLTEWINGEHRPA